MFDFDMTRENQAILHHMEKNDYPLSSIIWTLRNEIDLKGRLQLLLTFGKHWTCSDLGILPNVDDVNEDPGKYLEI